MSHFDGDSISARKVVAESMRRPGIKPAIRGGDDRPQCPAVQADESGMLRPPASASRPNS